jgi:hypothetical protein
MSCKFLLTIAVASLLLPVMVFAAPVHTKRRVDHHWHGYGFLPGYHQPPDNSVPIYSSRKSSGNGSPDDTPRYWFGGGRYYYGEPGYFRGRWNGGSFGPCWTSTPIGLIWNCG